MAFFRSWRKRCFIGHEKAQNAQKELKNDQKYTVFWSFKLDLTGGA